MVTIETTAESHRPRWRLRTAPVSSTRTIGTLWQRARARHRTLILAASLVAVAVLAASTLHIRGPAAHETRATSTGAATSTLYPTLSQSQLAQWNTETATPQGRAAIIAGFRKVLGNQAEFGFGPLPTTHADGNTIQLTAFHRDSMQYGLSGNHFWFILTDNDVRSGLGWSLKAACFWALPLAGALICGTIITAVEGASYGNATNHGVWGAVYWAPPHIVIGRW